MGTRVYPGEAGLRYSTTDGSNSVDNYLRI